jgi:hypothetical protein
MRPIPAVFDSSIAQLPRLDLSKKVQKKLNIGCEQNGNIHTLPALTQI